MRKRLVLVGNREDGIDKSAFIDSFDYVVRINRMNNFGLTGHRTDLLLVDLQDGFFQYVNLKEYKKIVDIYVKRIIVNEKYTEKRKEIFNTLFSDDLKTYRLSIPDIISYTKELDERFDWTKNVWPTNAFVMLYYLIKNDYPMKYDIFVANENPFRFIGAPACPHTAAAEACRSYYIQWSSEGLIQFI